ncbi:hypothetical protein RRG08_025904 [Elysia crispata]|uniref:Uncharacterized protein n=1 Tax=Elysia crispata TaxID=231223 RepID=A0AAE1DZR1_9GAST|nr:hypothetical protein RRG08_025904 [Elysia crispata]
MFLYQVASVLITIGDLVDTVYPNRIVRILVRFYLPPDRGRTIVSDVYQAVHTNVRLIFAPKPKLKPKEILKLTPQKPYVYFTGLDTDLSGLVITPGIRDQEVWEAMSDFTLCICVECGECTYRTASFLGNQSHILPEIRVPVPPDDINTGLGSQWRELTVKEPAAKH